MTPAERKERQKLAMAALIERAPAIRRREDLQTREFRALLWMKEPYGHYTGICLRSGEFFTIGRGEKEEYHRSRWCFTGREISPYCELYWKEYANFTSYAVIPVGKRGRDEMRWALCDTFCNVPPEGVCEKAAQGLEECGLYIDTIQMTPVSEGVLTMLKAYQDETNETGAKSGETEACPVSDFAAFQNALFAPLERQ